MLNNFKHFFKFLKNTHEAGLGKWKRINRKQKTSSRDLWPQLKIVARFKNLGTFGNVPKLAIFDVLGGAKCLLMLRFDS